MEFTALRYFYEAAQRQHITKAADALHIAQPALTKTIKALEEELGVKLFYKVGRGIVLSEYGKLLKEKAEKIIGEVDDLPIELEKLIDARRNTVDLNVLAASTITTKIIIDFKKSYPNALFKMTQQESKKKSDIMILTNTVGSELPPRVKRKDIIEERIFLAVPSRSAFAGRDEIDLRDTSECDFISLSGARRFRPLCDAYCCFAGFKPRVVFESDSLIAVKNLIAAGVGVAFWPEFSWGELENTDTIKLLRIKNPDCRREIITYLFEDSSETSERFYDFLIDRLKNKGVATDQKTTANERKRLSSPKNN